jgi:disulfide bond formation protein DsbB
VVDHTNASEPDGRTATIAGIIAAVGAAALSGAWYFQYVVGLQPCPLCLQQRIPYYLFIPLAMLVALGAHRDWRKPLISGGLVLIVLLLLGSAGLAIYHAGVEWKWWLGPQDCAGAGFTSSGAGNLLQQMQTARVVRCDEAPWRWLGLSLAGWNALISLALAALAIAGLLNKRAQGSSSLSQ